MAIFELPAVYCSSEQNVRTEHFCMVSQRFIYFVFLEPQFSAMTCYAKPDNLIMNQCLSMKHCMLLPYTLGCATNQGKWKRLLSSLRLTWNIRRLENGRFHLVFQLCAYDALYSVSKEFTTSSSHKTQLKLFSSSHDIESCLHCPEVGKMSELNLLVQI